MKLNWPGKPCQPSTPTHGGSMRPEESLVEQVVPYGGVVAVVHTLGGSLVALPVRPLIDLPVQSALAQYSAPGTRRAVGSEIVSTVLARFLALVDVPRAAEPAHGCEPPQVVSDPSAGPPTSYTTCVPVFL